MDSVLNEDPPRRRAREARKSGSVVHESDWTQLIDLADLVIYISKSSPGVDDAALPVADVVDVWEALRPLRSDASTSRRGFSNSKSLSPENAFEEHLLQLHLSEQSMLEGYANRIDCLRLIVEEDGRTICSDSEHDFWDFVDRHPFAQSGQIIVTDEGHLRLVWKGDDEAHIGIRFLGDRRVRYVIFNRRAGERALLETSGEDSLDGLVSQAHASGLQVFRA